MPDKWDKRSRGIKTNVQPSVGGGKRVPRTTVVPIPNDGSNRPVVSFQYADRSYDGEWSWPSGEDAATLLHFLCELGQWTWGEIASQRYGGQTRHRKHHELDFSVVCGEAQTRLSDLGHDQIFTEYFRFRLSGEKRLWGFRVGDVFYVLWWDANHMVYPIDLS